MVWPILHLKKVKIKLLEKDQSQNFFSEKAILELIKTCKISEQDSIFLYVTKLLKP